MEHDLPGWALCVGAVVLREDRVLWVRQAKGHSLEGQWSIPWGFVDAGEGAEEAAVRETLGGAGILVQHKEFEALAELLDLVLTDAQLRARVLAGQRERLRAFQRPAIEQRLRELLADWL